MSLFLDPNLLEQFNLIITAQDSATTQQEDFARRNQSTVSLAKNLISNLRSNLSGGVIVSDLDAKDLINLNNFLDKLFNEKSIYNNLPIVSSFDPANQGKNDYFQYNQKYSINLPGLNAYLQMLRNNLATNQDKTLLPLVNNLIQQSKQIFGSQIAAESLTASQDKTTHKTDISGDTKPTTTDTTDQQKQIPEQILEQIGKLSINLIQDLPFHKDGTIYFNYVNQYLLKVINYYKQVRDLFIENRSSEKGFFPFDVDQLINQINYYIKNSNQFANIYGVNRIKIDASNPNMSNDFGAALRRSGKSLSDKQISEAAFTLNAIINFINEDVFDNLINLFKDKDVGVGKTIIDKLVEQQQIANQKFRILPSIQAHWNR